MYGRCAHRGALMSDGFVKGDNLICGVHFWDYRLDTGVSEYNHKEMLHKFTSWVEKGEVGPHRHQRRTARQVYSQARQRGPE